MYVTCGGPSQFNEADWFAVLPRKDYERHQPYRHFLFSLKALTITE
jgi:hypothetical protein